ncbi:MAG: glycosyltransferase family 2 protein [Bacteroidota bacterium]|nr:glycosyltransferase family 2 protein [Bacteroidota bacterium]
METIIITIEIVLISIFGSIFLYLFSLSLLGLFYRRLKNFKTIKQLKFAMIIPAHNEEISIGKTIKSLFEVDYSRNQFDVIVVADNCTDLTAEIAKKHGAMVYERTDKINRGKGYALRWCIDLLFKTNRGYDAIAIIDADSVISKNFLSVLNFYISKGSKAIQTADLVAPQPDAWSSEVTRLGFMLYNFVRPLGRKVINCSAGVRGNGMCFTTKTLKEVPWDTYSLNEDLEYGLVLLLNGINVDFAPEAIVHATMPKSAKNAETQRARWERGRFPIIKKYSTKLLRYSIEKLSFRTFDAFIELITPPFVNSFAFAVLMLLINLVLLLLGIVFLKTFIMLWSFVILAAVAHVLFGLFTARADVMLFKAFLYIPKYIVWKILLYFKISRCNKNDEWIRTTRERLSDDQPK